MGDPTPTTTPAAAEPEQAPDGWQLVSQRANLGDDPSVFKNLRNEGG